MGFPCNLIGSLLALVSVLSVGLLLFGLGSQEWIIASSNSTDLHIGLAAYCSGATCFNSLPTVVAACRPMSDLRLRFDAVTAFFSIGVIGLLIGAFLGLAGFIGFQRDAALQRFVDTGALTRSESLNASVARRISGQRLSVSLFLLLVGAVCSLCGLGLFQDTVNTWTFCGVDFCSGLQRALKSADPTATNLRCSTGASWVTAFIGAVLGSVAALLAAVPSIVQIRRASAYTKDARTFRSNSAVTSHRSVSQHNGVTPVDAKYRFGGAALYDQSANSPDMVPQDVGSDDEVHHQDTEQQSQDRNQRHRSDVHSPTTAQHTPSSHHRYMKRLQPPRQERGKVVEEGWVAYDTIDEDAKNPGLFWHDELQLYFDVNAQCYYNPSTDEWYSPERDEWFSIA